MSGVGEENEAIAGATATSGGERKGETVGIGSSLGLVVLSVLLSVCAMLGYMRYFPTQSSQVVSVNIPLLIKANGLKLQSKNLDGPAQAAEMATFAVALNEALGRIGQHAVVVRADVLAVPPHDSTMDLTARLAQRFELVPFVVEAANRERREASAYREALEAQLGLKPSAEGEAKAGAGLESPTARESAAGGEERRGHGDPLSAGESSTRPRESGQ